jgi:hypothetical protein
VCTAALSDGLTYVHIRFLQCVLNV